MTQLCYPREQRSETRGKKRQTSSQKSCQRSSNYTPADWQAGPGVPSTPHKTPKQHKCLSQSQSPQQKDSRPKIGWSTDRLCRELLREQANAPGGCSHTGRSPSQRRRS